MVSASDPTQQQPVTIPLTQLQRGRKGRIALADGRAAEAVVLTNSLRLLAPVTAIGETAFASADHPVVAALIADLRDAFAP